jgi:hypothetical protein
MLGEEMEHRSVMPQAVLLGRRPPQKISHDPPDALAACLPHAVSADCQSIGRDIKDGDVLVSGP